MPLLAADRSRREMMSVHWRFYSRNDLSMSEGWCRSRSEKGSAWWGSVGMDGRDREEGRGGAEVEEKAEEKGHIGC